MSVKFHLYFKYFTKQREVTAVNLRKNTTRDKSNLIPSIGEGGGGAGGFPASPSIALGVLSTPYFENILCNIFFCNYADDSKAIPTKDDKIAAEC